MRAHRRTLIAGLLTLSLSMAACGGERQDANEPSGSFAMAISDATFPAQQTLAEQSELKLTVRNNDSKPLPDVAVTVDSFTTRDKQTGLADPERPVWVVDEGPVGGETAFVNTWALGPLAAGESKTFTWKVTAIRSGSFPIKYKASPGLDGKATPADTDKVTGEFSVSIDDKPAQARVDPETGKVIRGESAGAGK